MPLMIKHVIGLDEDLIHESRETTLTVLEERDAKQSLDSQKGQDGKLANYQENKRTATTATCQYSGAMSLKENRSSKKPITRSRVAYVCETSLAAPSQSLLN